ncbi:MAG: ATP synthase gamma chain [Thermoanaerobacterales bacterium 50_218]|nr:MAG: ATP synthase gamma chain [Thermoanaerobacterales bacterium 50_218]HAA89096.1 ATP synthase F1 subunit gamma [Peptococcaceae bacterium]
MPETMRDIKRRIRSIKNTQQITKAMEMVAAARLRRAQEKVDANTPYIEEIKGIINRLVVTFQGTGHPFLSPRERRSVGYVVFTSDRGLCGAFNAHVIRKTQNVLAEEEAEVKLIAVGRKGRDYFRRRGYSFLAEFLNIGDNPTIGQAREIVRSLTRFFEDGVLDEINLVYMRFISVGRQKPTMIKLLPVEFREQAEQEDLVREYLIEPDAATFLDLVMPRFLEAQLYRVLLESKASEHASRMVAMSNATDNAGEMIRQLTLSFNKARQAAITKEITEIVSGAEALKKTGW